MKFMAFAGRLCVFCGIAMAGYAFGAQRVLLHRLDNAASTDKRGHVLDLEPGASLQEIKRIDDGATGRVHIRMQQFYRGREIYGHHVLVTRDRGDAILDLHGTLIRGIGADLGEVANAPRHEFSPQEWLKLRESQFKGRFGDVPSWLFYNESAKKVIYLAPAGQTAVEAVYVSFVADSSTGGKPARPVYLIDEITGENLLTYDGLTFDEASGPGGNARTGQYFYGKQYPALDVNYNSATDTSTMRNEHVATVNLNHGTSGKMPFSFKGRENLVKSINGAYAPLNDAHFFGSVVFKMYKDWLNTAPLTFQLQMRVHYSKNYENAFWDGSGMTFGDGGGTFYPLVALDVSAHEVSHGFTEQNSKLTYEKQSGGINEAFSDMAGEAAEFYARGVNDFIVGHEIMKEADGLRYFADPPRDGESIGSAKDYTDDLDVHYTSGVYNKAFYTLATSAGWDTKKAFLTFAKANQSYWEPSTTYLTGAIGVCKAAGDLGYAKADVEAAFAAVDVMIPGCKEPAPADDQ